MPEILDYLHFVLAPQMLNGLALGVSVILVAVGLTIIFGLLDVINMSHGEFYAIGAFGALALSLSGFNYWILVALVPILMIPLGVVTERYLIRRVYDGPDRHVSTLLLTFGLGLIFEDVLKIFFGPNTHRPANPLPGATDLFGVFIPTYRLFLIVIGIAVILGVAWVVYRTRLGAMVRAASFDRNMAASLGVRGCLPRSTRFFRRWVTISF